MAHESVTLGTDDRQSVTIGSDEYLALDERDRMKVRLLAMARVRVGSAEAMHRHGSAGDEDHAPSPALRDKAYELARGAVAEAVDERSRGSFDEVEAVRVPHGAGERARAVEAGTERRTAAGESDRDRSSGGNDRPKGTASR